MSRLLAGALFLRAAAATFADDAGLDEALRVHVGPAFAAAPLGDAFLLATAAGALAKVDAQTGAIAWRTVLPSGAFWVGGRARARARQRRRRR